MGGAQSTSRIRYRKDLKEESRRDSLEQFDESRAKAISLRNAERMGLNSRVLDDIISRRAAISRLDFSKEKEFIFGCEDLGQGAQDTPKKAEFSFPIQTFYGLYSGFKFTSRKACQDRVLVKELNVLDRGKYLMVGVYDGHGLGGDHCSAYVVANMWKILEKCLNEFPDDVFKAIKKTFKRTDMRLRNHADQDPRCDVELSGTTATIVLIDCHTKGPRKIYVANVGDSKAVISSSQADARNRFGVVNLTLDHNFEDSYEVQRAKSKGGFVSQLKINGEPQGPPRIFHSEEKTRPGLAVSRSLGDTEAHSVGVSSEPDILEMTLNPEKGVEDVIIVASDGIWDMLSGRIIMERFDKNGYSMDVFTDIMLESARRWLYSRSGVCDDISMVVVRLDAPLASTSRISEPTETNSLHLLDESGKYTATSNEICEKVDEELSRKLTLSFCKDELAPEAEEEEAEKIKFRLASEAGNIKTQPASEETHSEDDTASEPSVS